MRWPTILLAGVALLPSGCSMFVASAGTDLGELKSREVVRAKFGEPDEVRCTDEGVCEVYHTRRLVAGDRAYNMYKAMGFAMTFGLSELYYFPNELRLMTQRTLFGQEVLFGYDAEGTLIRAERGRDQYYSGVGRETSRTSTAVIAIPSTDFPKPE